MAKTKKYKSEKKIKVGKKEYWLIKIEDIVTVLDGDEIVFDGTANEFQKWLKDNK
jgi:hypothetical protein